MKLQQGHLGILLTQDLIFSIKVTGTARAMGLQVVVVGDLERAEEVCRQQRPGCVLIDLGIPGLKVAETVERLRAASGGVPVVAYGAHVERATMDAAATAGCREVLPRSKFSNNLSLLVRRYLASTGQDGQPVSESV